MNGRTEKRLRTTGRVLFITMLTVFVVAPLVAILGSSVTTSTSWRFPPDGVTSQWYEEFANSGALVRAAGTSVAVGVVVALTGTVIGMLAALAIGRDRRGERKLLGMLALLPLLFPNIALGLAILTFYVEAGIPVGVGTLAIAQLVLVLPFVIRILMVGISSVRSSAERAAQNLGAGPVTTLFRVTFPMMRGAIVAAVVLALVQSLDDAAIALFVNTGRLVTLPVALLFLRETEGGPLIAAGGSVLLIVGVVLLVVMARSFGLGRAFGFGGQGTKGS